MSRVTVNTKEELSRAKDAKATEIIVTGELANKLKRAKKITLLGTGTLAALIALLSTATATAPITGGSSYLVAAFVAAPAATLTGLEIATIIVALSLGIGLIIALFKDYEEIEYSKERLILRRRSSKAQ